MQAARIVRAVKALWCNWLVYISGLPGSGQALNRLEPIVWFVPGA
jgi:hypothetical protein